MKGHPVSELSVACVYFGPTGFWFWIRRSICARWFFVESGGIEEGGSPPLIRGFMWQFQEIVGSGGELNE